MAWAFLIWITRGRIVACEFPEYWFVCVYTPNAQNELARIDHRMEWDDAFRDFCKGLEEGVLPQASRWNVPAPTATWYCARRQAVAKERTART